jgi:hypothetical protein
MKPSFPDIYGELYSITEDHPVINTHCHHIPDPEYRDYDLDVLVRNSYLNWFGSLSGPPAQARQALLDKVRYHSSFVWLQKGLQQLYRNAEPLDEAHWEGWSARIRAAYQDPSFKQDVLAVRCGYRRMVLDAYWDPGSDNGYPGQYTPAYRVNAFHFGFSPLVVDSDGNSPYALYPRSFIAGLDEYVAWVRAHIAAKKASGCVALKVPLAYDRGLDFCEVPPAQAQAALTRLAALSPSSSGAPIQPNSPRPFPSNAPGPALAMSPLPGADPRDVKDFQDYIFFQICAIAAELDLPVQIHTGTGQGRRTNALQLDEAIQKNPDTRFVLLHCSYPWTQDTVMLAMRYANVYPDLSMLPLYSSQACKTVLHELIEAGAASRLAWGCDTWTPEESFGSLLAFRYALCSALAEKTVDGYFSLEDARQVIAAILFDNANVFYGLNVAGPEPTGLKLPTGGEAS